MTLNTRVTDASVDLIVTSPPFPLVINKEYGNASSDSYLGWFRPFAAAFAAAFARVLKDSGSLVIDLGGAWMPGQPTKSLYQYEMLVMLVREFGYHLAQDFFWCNPATLPGPAEWVTVRRIRPKGSVNCVWWLSKTPWPRASNRRVPVPYSASMRNLLKTGCHAQKRPSGHAIGESISLDNGATIASNLLVVANTESNSGYLRYCREHGIKAHPARFPSTIPEFFVRMLTDRGDLVIDPFAGSCVTGEVCERLERRWKCCELVPDYVQGALGRFTAASPGHKRNAPGYYISHPGAAWTDNEEPLVIDGGRQRPPKKKTVLPGE